jgi:N-acetylglucosamine-6-phosphate deacetylase
MNNIMRYITSKFIFDGKNLLEDKVVIIDKHRIIEIIPRNSVTLKQQNIEDYGDNVIAPGFIDLQLNGCGGVLFNNQINGDSLEVIYQTCLKYGTTSFLPTMITCDFRDVIISLQVIKAWFAKYNDMRGVLGIHLEGPFISVTKKGIHPEKYIIKPTHGLLEQIVSYRKYFPIMMTIAVEEFDAEQIKFLIDNKIVLSIGHSNATYLQAKAAFDLGVSSATHVFNAMSGLTSRNPGVIGAVLNNQVYNGVIVDNLHVNNANLEILYKLKLNHTYLVTDAVTPMGAEGMTQFELAGKTLYIKGDKCLDENGVLGGAYLSMNQAVANCVNSGNISLNQALNMASQIPAKVLGSDNKLGKISPGFYANLIALNSVDFSCTII